MATEGRLRAAVIGVGALGKHHARLMAEVEGVELAAVVDADLDRARAVAGPLGAAVHAGLEGLPGDIRVASVAVPTSAHHAVVATLLRRGIHVLVEKPMAASVAEARELAELARARRLVLHVGHVERFNPALGAFRKLGLRPRFIEAHRLAPFTYRAVDTSVVMDLMIHDLDIVLSLVGSPLVEVAAVGSRVLSPQVDIANARLTFRDGCVANVTASRVSFEPLRRTRVFADEAFASIDYGSRKAFVARKSPGFDLGSLDGAAAARVPHKPSFREFVAQGLLELQEFDLGTVEVNPLKDELCAFVAEARGLACGVGVDARAGLAAMELAERVTAAIADHRWEPG